MTSPDQPNLEKLHDWYRPSAQPKGLNIETCRNCKALRMKEGNGEECKQKDEYTDK